ncbi:MAG: ATP-dependent helicase [Anaerolineae bacterium]|nr:ATP-dependent helicase [Anaerolineae bacterium]
MNETDIQEKFQKIHSDDIQQLEVILSSEGRILVEAPAGYGKTKTMISKIANLMATNQIPNPKKLLALTFSVNAAYKIKKDVAEQIPELLQTDFGPPFRVNEKVFVSNYHGFCRHVLKRYGYLIADNLANINILKSIDDSKAQDLMAFGVGLSLDDAKFFSDVNDAIRELNTNYLRQNFREYCHRVASQLLPHDLIPFNAILMLTILLFKDYPRILNFYQKYFPVIIIDEFQDTNILSYQLIETLVASNTQLILMGDSLQRIYGFIGAIPNLLSRAKEFFSMKEIVLTKNHRFENNPQMLNLDANLRENAKNPANPNISESACVEFDLLEDQIEEANWLTRKIQTIQSDNPNSKIAVLVRQRSQNTKRILEVFKIHSLQFFYALFSDEDQDYVDFHRICLRILIDILKTYKGVSSRCLRSLLTEVKAHYSDDSSPLIEALLSLLEIFCQRIVEDFAFLDVEDRITLMKDILESNALKQNLEFVKTNLVISTIHGAKGLEWDYVYLPDMEQYSLPNYPGLCGKCNCQQACNLKVTQSLEADFLQELCVFYVGVTRARMNVSCSASRKRIRYDGTVRSCNVSCFLNLKGIELVSSDDLEMK